MHLVTTQMDYFSYNKIACSQNCVRLFTFTLRGQHKVTSSDNQCTFGFKEVHSYHSIYLSICTKFVIFDFLTRFSL